jgi:hypothetical protein
LGSGLSRKSSSTWSTASAKPASRFLRRSKRDEKLSRFSGFEEWKFAADGLIAASQGHFAADYQRQLERGAT